MHAQLHIFKLAFKKDLMEHIPIQIEKHTFRSMHLLRLILEQDLKKYEYTI